MPESLAWPFESVRPSRSVSWARSSASSRSPGSVMLSVLWLMVMQMVLSWLLAIPISISSAMMLGVCVGSAVMFGDVSGGVNEMVTF